MSSQRSVTPRRPRPVFQGPTYLTPEYHTRTWGRLVFLGFILLLVAALAATGGLYWALHRAQGSSAGAKVFRVSAGDSVSTIATRLQHDGLVNNALLFKVDARLQGLGAKLKPGTYSLRGNMNIDQMVATFSVYKPVFVKVLIPEGWRASQIAEALTRQGQDGAGFLRAVEHPSPAYFNESVLNDKPKGAGLQGYLFPNTYDVQPHASGAAIARQMVTQLDTEITPAMRASIRQQGRTVFQVLILASIVEREARVPSERPLIAGVYWRRLHLPRPAGPMMLDADPTVQYVVGVPGNWWPTLRQGAATVQPADPYNTYTHYGFPPGPIANPGLSSIEAAIHPASTHYLFFLAIPHGGGKHVFSDTLAQQLANQQKYGY